MDVLEEDKKSIKSWLVTKRNKRDLLINKQVKQVHDEQERLRELEEERAHRLSLASAAGAKKEDAPWMAKTMEVRNRLNDQKRGSAERWNRFAGTMDGGGRGL
jgi:hypothetical protein